MKFEVEGLTITYGAQRAVRDVSFGIEEGEVFALLGANGAGKTSILRAVSGLVAPNAGEIRWAGESLTGRSPTVIVKRGVAQVPEGRKPFPAMSVYDNLLVGATPHIRDRARTKRLLARSFEMFPILEERKAQTAGTLSGGEQQQMVIARGLMSDPQLLMIDEPTLGLAPVISNQLVDSMQNLAKLGLTLLISEQNADFALRCASRAIVMSAGEVTLTGRSQELLGTSELQQAYLGGAPHLLDSCG